MKRWPLIVALLYALIFAVLTLPFLMLAMGKRDSGLTFRQACEVYQNWQYWAILGVMLLCQYVLLALPVRVASRRPEAMGALWRTVLVAGLMMALLAGGVAFTVYEWIWADKGPNLMWAVLVLFMERSKRLRPRQV